MDPNLMGPAGFEPTGQQACHWLLALPGFRGLTAVAFEHLPMGDGLAPAGAHRHAIARPGVAVDRPVDRAMWTVGRAPDQGEVAALERLAAPAAAGGLGRQRAGRAGGPGGNQEAGGVLVEAVHDAWPPLAADAGEAVAAMRDQRIDESAGPI